ncbi:hypothetical protein P835_01623 [Citrobacter portucalensis]|nr:hypothetical protein P835_01623 [Citrobacter portucalensis]
MMKSTHDLLARLSGQILPVEVIAKRNPFMGCEVTKTSIDQ